MWLNEGFWDRETVVQCLGQIITCPYKRETGGQRERERKRGGEKRCCAAGFEDRGRSFEPRTVSRSWRGKESDSPRKPPEGAQPMAHFRFLTCGNTRWKVCVVLSHLVSGNLLQRPQEVVQLHTQFRFYSGCSGKLWMELEEGNDEFLRWSPWLLYRELAVRKEEWEEMGSGKEVLAVVTCTGWRLWRMKEWIDDYTHPRCGADRTQAWSDLGSMKVGVKDESHVSGPFLGQGAQRRKTGTW